jgi:hypothetical protein
VEVAIANLGLVEKVRIRETSLIGVEPDGLIEMVERTETSYRGQGTADRYSGSWVGEVQIQI